MRPRLQRRRTAASLAAPGRNEEVAMSQVRVLAMVTAKPGRRNEVLALFRANVPAVRAEAGCLEYGATIDAEGVGAFQARLGPDSFAVIETWESLAALQAHAVAPHMKAYAERTRDLVASRAIHVLSPA